MLKHLKFEYLFAVLIVLILAGALAWSFALKDKELIMPTLMALIGTLSAITAYLFTKHMPKADVPPPAPQIIQAEPIRPFEPRPRQDREPQMMPQPPPSNDTQK